MACKETKWPVRRERKYTARKDRNENSILQQDKRAKVDETTKKEYLVWEYKATPAIKKKPWLNN